MGEKGMWKDILGLLDETTLIVCAVLAFLVPFITYKLNRKLHNFGDPPWKKEEKGTDEKS
ncbi:hypothetical protein [Lentibacillus sp. Marseille-P4043]|uniref:hypothetical protein n=1 Tax=Lentibacillus sp. Marseille-P4043 TaxID=2040293 RepID=UPI000D0B880E|nr:hypothetical protein [Lentibacillus sp. Marseille-P4043]